VGTGSGCIAVALAANMPDLQVTASDISAGAVQVAAENARRHKLGQRVRVVQADLLNGVEGPFDLICANLPYIPSARVKDLDVYAREPHIALDGGADGLVFIRGLMQQAQSKLAAGGLLLAEIDPELVDGIQTLAQECFAASQLSIRADLAGRPRLVIIAK
jgi:release factor glutamine methyltransferase